MKKKEKEEKVHEEDEDLTSISRMFKKFTKLQMNKWRKIPYTKKKYQIKENFQAKTRRRVIGAKICAPMAHKHHNLCIIKGLNHPNLLE